MRHGQKNPSAWVCCDNWRNLFCTKGNKSLGKAPLFVTLRKLEFTLSIAWDGKQADGRPEAPVQNTVCGQK